ncbi:hypothetical protein Q3G72_007361 [Acer saccharum]|nr:hypothetical protein Q3G72_007361 [Acer saccharum]
MAFRVPWSVLRVLILLCWAVPVMPPDLTSMVAVEERSFEGGVNLDGGAIVYGGHFPAVEGGGGRDEEGKRSSWPEFGSGKAIRARVPVISAEVGLIPQPTQPEGDIKVPKKQRSRVALCAWNVHASEVCCVGSVMHFWKVFVDVVVVQWAENAIWRREEKKKKKKKRKRIFMVVEEKRREEKRRERGLKRELKQSFLLTFMCV